MVSRELVAVIRDQYDVLIADELTYLMEQFRADSIVAVTQAVLESEQPSK